MVSVQPHSHKPTTPSQVNGSSLLVPAWQGLLIIVVPNSAIPLQNGKLVPVKSAGGDSGGRRRRAREGLVWRKAGPPEVRRSSATNDASLFTQVMSVVASSNPHAHG
jgi:hypothetical protein